MLKEFVYKKSAKFKQQNLADNLRLSQARWLLNYQQRHFYRKLNKHLNRTGSLPNDNDQIWDRISEVHENFCRCRWQEKGKILNLDNPRTLGEKVEWLKLNDHRELYIQISDKIRVRDYVLEKTENPKILNKIIRIYDSPSEIVVDDLPAKFAIKTNHNCGGNFFCLSKDSYDAEMIIKIDKLLNTKYGSNKAEWAYWHIQPKVFIEEYLEDQFSELVDYKVYCFNGEPKVVNVCAGRSINENKRLFFDTKWQLIPVKDAKYPVIPLGKDFPPPESLEQMLHYSILLSQDLPYIRVDFYDLYGECRFGEMTPYPGGGLNCVFDPKEWEDTFGEWLTLPKPNRNPKLAYSKN